MEHIETPHGQLPKMGLGTFSIPLDQLPETIGNAIALDCNMIDTALLYNNEAQIGDILQRQGHHRNAYLLETKIDGKTIWGTKQMLHLNRISIRRAYRNACRKLKSNHIDIFLIHSPFRHYERFVKKLNRMKKMGQIQLWGICNISLERLQKLYAQTGIYPDVVQIEVHPYFTNTELVNFCQKNGIIVEARSPLTHGKALKEWAKEPVLQNIAQRYEMTIPQVILRWNTQRNIIVLPRTTSMDHMRENVGSFNFTLSQEDIAAISSLNKNQSYGVK